MTEKIRVTADYSVINRGIELWILQDDNKVAELTFIPYTPGNRVQSTLSLSTKGGQDLMDQLWQCGLRPTEGQGSAGALLATEKHLSDMRTIVAKCLKMEL